MIYRKVVFSLFLVLVFFTHGSFAAEKPLIGILLNSGGDEGYSQYPWYAIRKNYGQVIAQNGGIPVYIGHDWQTIEDYLDKLDGIVLTGGDFSTPAEAYTTGIKGKKIDLKKGDRNYMEYALVQKAYEKDIPILGICAGLQNMNIALGGTIHENLLKSGVTKIQHKHDNREKVQHKVNILEKSKLLTIVGEKTLSVNSNHKAGIKKVSPLLSVTATAPDGVIEGLEAKDKRFFMGVMWHPEFLLSKQESALWKSFIDASGKYHQEK